MLNLKDTDYFKSNTAQRVLCDYYGKLTSSPFDYQLIPDTLESLEEIRFIEDNWMTSAERDIEAEILPSNGMEFADWYRKKLKSLNNEIASLLHYLEHDARPEEIAYYVRMEELVDGSFDDIMALAQIGVDNEAKLTIAENYWDEMGNGSHDDIHTIMFASSADYCKKLLEKNEVELPETVSTECLMNGNLILFWALRRKFIHRLFGAIGLIEGSAPLRFSAVTRGMVRCGFPESVIRYHREHIRIDAIHGKEWLDRVLMYYVKNDERICQEVSRGVLIRYRIASNYYRHLDDVIRNKPDEHGRTMYGNEKIN